MHMQYAQLLGDFGALGRTRLRCGGGGGGLAPATTHRGHVRLGKDLRHREAAVQRQRLVRRLAGLVRREPACACAGGACWLVRQIINKLIKLIK